MQFLFLFLCRTRGSLSVATVNCCMFLGDRYSCFTNYAIDSCVRIGPPQRRLAKIILKKFWFFTMNLRGMKRSSFSVAVLQTFKCLTSRSWSQNHERIGTILVILAFALHFSVAMHILLKVLNFSSQLLNYLDDWMIKSCNSGAGK